MGGKWVECAYCGDEIKKKDAIYVGGRPYCEDCHNEAEIMIDVPDGEDDDGDYDEDDFDD